MEAILELHYAPLFFKKTKKLQNNEITSFCTKKKKLSHGKN